MEQYNWVLLDNWLEKHGTLGLDEQRESSLKPILRGDRDSHTKERIFRFDSSSRKIKRTKSKRA